MKLFWNTLFSKIKTSMWPSILALIFVFNFEAYVLSPPSFIILFTLTAILIWRRVHYHREKWYQDRWFAPLLGFGVGLMYYDLWHYTLKLEDSLFKTLLPLMICSFIGLVIGLLIRFNRNQKEAYDEAIEINRSLEKSEAQYHSILNSMPIVIFRANADGTWNYVNDEWQSLTNQTILESHDFGWKSAIISEDHDKLERELAIAIFMEGEFSSDFQLKTRDHSLKHIRLTMKPLRNRHDEHVGFIGTAENRTEKHRIESIVKASQKIDRFLSSSPPSREIIRRSIAILGESLGLRFAGYWEVDSIENKLYLTDHWHPIQTSLTEFITQSKNLKFSKNEGLPGQAWAEKEIIVSPNLEKDFQFIRKTQAEMSGIRGGIALPLIIDKRFLGVMDLLTPFTLDYTPTEIEEFRSIAINIGQVLIKKKAEEELKDVRQYIEQQTAAINSFALISMADTDGTITYINDNFVALSQFSRNEILGKDHRMFRSGYHSADFFENLWNTLLSGKTWKGEVCNKAKDGTLFWLDATIVPFLGSHGATTQFVAIYSDITDKKETEKKLFHSAKLSSLGEMAGGIAHEINNPLTIIAGMAETITKTLAREPLDKERMIKASQRIVSTVDRVSKIVKGLKTFARDGSRDDFESFPVNQLLHETIDFCEGRLQSLGIKLEIQELNNNVNLYCRPIEIEQVLLNLLNNAVDAIQTLGERWIRISAHLNSESNQLQLRIADSGTGIPPAVQEKLFTPFFTTKGVGKGTGLGLSISMGIIEQHKGRLYIDNNINNTCFVIEFDLTENNSLKVAA